MTAAQRQIIRDSLGGEARTLARIDHGYDFEVALVDDEWIFRFPRRPSVAEALEADIAVLPVLARALPVAVPRFEHVVREPVLAVVYRLIDGEPAVDEDPEGIARFLSALHVFDAAGLPVERPDWRASYEEQCARFSRTVGRFSTRASGGALDTCLPGPRHSPASNPLSSTATSVRSTCCAALDASSA